MESITAEELNGVETDSMLVLTLQKSVEGVQRPLLTRHLHLLSVAQGLVGGEGVLLAPGHLPLKYHTEGNREGRGMLVHQAHNAA